MKTKGKEKRSSGAGRREKRKAAPKNPRRRRRQGGVTFSTAARQIAVDAREIAGATDVALDTVADATREIADAADIAHETAADFAGKIDKFAALRGLVHVADVRKMPAIFLGPVRIIPP